MRQTHEARTHQSRKKRLRVFLLKYFIIYFGKLQDLFKIKYLKPAKFRFLRFLTQTGIFQIPKVPTHFLYFSRLSKHLNEDSNTYNPNLNRSLIYCFDGKGFIYHFPCFLKCQVSFKHFLKSFFHIFAKRHTFDSHCRIYS